jgi:long-chain acyl-CoA synthetase
VTPGAPTSATDVARLLREVAGAGPQLQDRPAFTFYRAGMRSSRLAWRDLAAAVHRAAAALAERHGVRRGDRVAVLMPNGDRTAVVLLAVMALGAVAVPLNPVQDHAEWSFAARDSGCVGAVVAESMHPHAASLAQATGFLCTDWELCAHEPHGAALSTDDLAQAPAVILYTSGTTGQPKGVVLTHANLLANGRAMARHFGLDGDAQLAVMPLYHAHALGFGLMSALVSGGHLVLSDGLNAFHWQDIVRAEQVRATSVVPTLLPFLLKLRVHADKVPTLKALLVSSAPLSQRLAQDFIDQTGIALVQGWGLSEFTNFATCSDVAGVEASRRQLAQRAWPSIGRPLPGFDVQVRGDDGTALPAGEKGELHVRGASRMLGYFGRPPTDGDWLATGDEGYFEQDEQGPLYFITGRIKDLIIRNAEKVSPLAIEGRLLEACPALQGKLAVVGYAHELNGEEIGAYVEAPDGSGALAACIARAADALPNTLRPKVVLWGTPPIPRTHTGKVQRALLKPMFDPYRAYNGPTRLEAAWKT